MKRYITTHPNILGGKPVITGTRIPVDQILFLLKSGFTVEAIHEEYPQVSQETIAGTVDEAAELLNKNASQIL
ncbi:MAG: DUF433 domain-containing protein [Candidatus Levyibacteriota bacterium]